MTDTGDFQLKLSRVKGREPASPILVATYVLTFASQALVVGLIISGYKISMHTAGDFWASMAGIVFLANIFGIGSDRFISVQIHRLKRFYMNSLRSNITNVFLFFITFFSIVTFFAGALDLAAYFLFKYYPSFTQSKASHPVELCLFCMFFFLSSNFMTAFLQSEGYYSGVMKVAIFAILLRIILVIVVMRYNIRFDITGDDEYNLVFTLCFLISLPEIIKIIGYTKYIYQYLILISPYNEEKLDSQWKKDIWLYALHSLQYDWILVGTITVEIFGRSESDPAVFGYLFGVVRMFHMLGRIIQQLTRDYLVRSLYDIKTSYISFRKLVFLGTVATFLIMIVVLCFDQRIALYYKIPQYIHQLDTLVTIAAVRAFAEAFLIIVIFAYSKKIMRFYVYISTVIFFGYIFAMTQKAQFGVKVAIQTYTHFYLTATIFETVLGMIVLYLILKRNQLGILWTYNKTNSRS